MKNRDSPYFSRLAAIVLALALSPAAIAQSGKVYRIGFLETTSASANRANLDAFLRGIREAGYVEGKNLVIDYRSADGRAERFTDLAKDLVRARPDVIVTRGSTATHAATKAGSVPIVMSAVADPVGARIVTNLARPGGNVTGLSALVSELGAKRMQIIKEMVPGVRRVGFMINMANPVSPGQWQEIERGAGPLGLEARLFDVRSEEALRRAFEQAQKGQLDAMLATGEAVMAANRRLLAELEIKHRMPVMHTQREFVDAGGLISYGVHYPDLYYRTAGYVDKILKGAKPGDLPIEQPSKLKLVVNLKTAKALGIQFSREFLARTDEAIQ